MINPNIAAQSKINLKKMWSNICSELKPKTNLATLLQDNMYKTSTEFGDKEKANILQKQLFRVFTQEQNDEMTVLDKKVVVNLCNIVFQIKWSIGKY